MMAEEGTNFGGLKGIVSKGKSAGEKAKSFGGKVKESGQALKDIWTDDGKADSIDKGNSSFPQENNVTAEKQETPSPSEEVSKVIGDSPAQETEEWDADDDD